MGDEVDIGFIDVLTGFLCVSVFLMVMIKPGKAPSQDVTGPPKDFVWYQIKISQGNNLEGFELDHVKLKAIIKINDQLKTMAIDGGSGGLLRDEFGLIEMENDIRNEFYAWGPLYTTNSDGKINRNEIVYNIYGVSREVIRPENLNMGILYYDYRDIEYNQNPQLLAAHRIYVQHDIRTLTLTDDLIEESPTSIRKTGSTISLGDYDFFR